MCERIIKELRAELSRTQKDYLTMKVIAANNELEAFESRSSASCYEDTIGNLEIRIQKLVECLSAVSDFLVTVQYETQVVVGGIHEVHFSEFGSELASLINEIHNTLTT